MEWDFMYVFVRKKLILGIILDEMLNACILKFKNNDTLYNYFFQNFTGGFCQKAKAIKKWKENETSYYYKMIKLFAYEI